MLTSATETTRKLSIIPANAKITQNSMSPLSGSWLWMLTYVTAAILIDQYATSWTHACPRKLTKERG